MSALAPAPTGDTSRPAVSPWCVFQALQGDRPLDVALLKATRPDELEQVIDIVGAGRVSILYSPSGNGKSSIIDAGIVPQFKSRGYAIFRTRPRPPFAQQSPSEAFKACMIRGPILPERRPELVDELRRALEALEDLPDDKRKAIRDIATHLQAEVLRPISQMEAVRQYTEAMQPYAEHRLDEFISQTQRYLGPHIQMLLVCDQFEELFVHYHNTRQLREFIEDVGAVYRNPDVRAQFLFSMREDLVGKMIEFRKHIPDVFSYSYKLPPLAVKHAAEAIALPAQQQHVPMAPALVTAVSEDLAAYYETEVQQIEFLQDAHLPMEQRYLELPAIQVVMNKLWQDSADDPSLEKYQKLGADGASPAASILRGYLRELLQKFEEKPTRLGDIRRDALYALTDGRFYRRALGRKRLFEHVLRLYPSQLNPAPVTPDELDGALQPLIEKGIVLVDETQDGPQYELAHDFLVRSVVVLWQEQDRRRAAAIGRMERAQSAERSQVARSGRWSLALFLCALLLLPFGYLTLINPILPNEHDFFYSTATDNPQYRPDANAVNKANIASFLPYIFLMLVASGCAISARYIGAAIFGFGASVAALGFLVAPVFTWINRDRHWGWRVVFAIATMGVAGLVFARVWRHSRKALVFAAEVIDVALNALWVTVCLGSTFGGGWFVKIILLLLPFLMPVILGSETFGYRLAGLRHYTVHDNSRPKRWRLLFRALLKLAIYSAALMVAFYGLWYVS